MRGRTGNLSFIVTAAVVVTVVALPITRAPAQTPQKVREMAEDLGVQWCNGEGSPNLASEINACTGAIHSGKFSGKNLASLFYGRAGAYYANSDYEHAIQDYDEAIRLDPGLAKAVYERGFAKRAKGDTSGGDADIASANQLQPGIARSEAVSPDKQSSPTVFTCHFQSSSFVLDDNDLKLLAKEGITSEKLASFAWTSKVRSVICDSRKIARELKERNNCDLTERYKHYAVRYFDKSEKDKLLKLQTDIAAAEFAGRQPPRCR